jgi:prepilin-type N-terminal cleavage/methylation domain-containing protein
MSNKLKELRAKEGFTIIEVIIVLVIGAVIMLAVFLVVPQLQRTQRNTARQALARQIFSAAEQFAANNNGTYPTTSANITDITGTLKDGSTTVTITPNTTTADVPANYDAVGEVQIATNLQCGTTNSTAPTNVSGKFSVVIYQETSSSTSSLFCVPTK